MERTALIALFAIPVLMFAWICWSRFGALLRRPDRIMDEHSTKRYDLFNEIQDRLAARRYMGLDYPQATPPWLREETRDSRKRRLA